MPTAKVDLFDGFTLVAAKGTYVSNSSVDAHGWHDQVEAGDDPTSGEDNTREQPQLPNGPAVEPTQGVGTAPVPPAA